MLDRFMFDSPSLKINCSYGINLMYNLSAIGKSYALTLMKDIGSKYLIVHPFSTSIEYDNFFRVEGTFKKGDILFLDRCDLFLKEDIANYIKTRKDLIIFMDLKNPLYFFSFNRDIDADVIVDSDTIGEVTITDDINLRRRWYSKHQPSYI